MKQRHAYCFKAIKLLLCFTLSIIISTKVSARIVNADNTKEADYAKVKTVNIFFNADVSTVSIVELNSLLDSINQMYNKADNINLFINSFGGDTTAGFIAYQHIKSSKIPVTTIADGAVASMGSIMFCAASNRLAMQEQGFFLLHAFSKYPDGGPDRLVQIDQNREVLNSLSQTAKNIYKQCTNLSDKRLDTLMYSEDNHIFVRGKEAIKIGLISKIITTIPLAQASYYILNDK